LPTGHGKTSRGNRSGKSSRRKSSEREQATNNDAKNGGIGDDDGGGGDGHDDDSIALMKVKGDDGNASRKKGTAGQALHFHASVFARPTWLLLTASDPASIVADGRPCGGAG
jgi:hypothetical protein